MNYSIVWIWFTVASLCTLVWCQGTLQNSIQKTSTQEKTSSSVRTGRTKVCADGHFYKYRDQKHRKIFSSCSTVGQGDQHDLDKCKETASSFNVNVDVMSFVEAKACDFLQCVNFSISNPSFYSSGTGENLYIRCEHLSDQYFTYYANADNEGTYYADGVVIGTSNDWKVVNTFQLPLLTKVLAIAIQDNDTKSGSFFMDTNSLNIYSVSQSIKCTNQSLYNTAWTLDDYDDKSWYTTVKTRNTDYLNNTSVLFMRSTIAWIDTQGTKWLYCRLKLHDRPNICADPDDVKGAAMMYPFALSESIRFICVSPGLFSNAEGFRIVKCSNKPAGEWLTIDDNDLLDTECSYELGSWQLNLVSPGAPHLSNTNWTTGPNGYIDGAVYLDGTPDSFIHIGHDASSMNVSDGSFTIFMYIQPNITDNFTTMPLFSWLRSDGQLITHVRYENGDIVVHIYTKENQSVEFRMTYVMDHEKWSKFAVSMRLYAKRDCILHVQYESQFRIFPLDNSTCALAKNLATPKDIYIGTIPSITNMIYQGNITCVELWHGYFQLHKVNWKSKFLSPCFWHCAPHHDVWLAEVSPSRYRSQHSPHGTTLKYKCKYIYRFPNNKKEMTTTCSYGRWKTDIPYQCTGLAGFWPLDYIYPSRDISLQHNPDTIQNAVTLSNGPYGLANRAKQFTGNVASSIELQSRDGVLDINAVNFEPFLAAYGQNGILYIINILTESRYFDNGLTCMSSPEEGSLSFAAYIFIKSDTSGLLFHYPSDTSTEFWINPDKADLSSGQADFYLSVTNMNNKSQICEFNKTLNIAQNNWNRVGFSIDMQRGRIAVYVVDTVKHHTTCKFMAHGTHNTTQNPIIGPDQVDAQNRYFNGKISCVQLHSGVVDFTKFSWENSQMIPCLATCPLFVHTYGAADDVIGYLNGSRLEINLKGVEIFKEEYDVSDPEYSRGYYFVKISANCKNISTATFRPHQGSSEGVKLLEYLKAMEFGEIVLAALNYNPMPSTSVANIYMRQLDEDKVHTKYIGSNTKNAFILRKGSKYIEQMHSSARYDPLSMNIGLYHECGLPLDFPFSTHFDVIKTNFHYEQKEFRNNYGIGSIVTYTCHEGFEFPDHTTAQNATCVGNKVLTNWTYPALCEAYCGAELLSWGSKDTDLPYKYDKHHGYIKVNGQEVINIDGNDATHRGLHLVTLSENCTVVENRSFTGYHASSAVRQSLKSFLESQTPGTIIAGITAYEPRQNIDKDGVGPILQTLLVPFWRISTDHSMSFLTRVDADNMTMIRSSAGKGPSHLQVKLQRGCGNPLNKLKPYTIMTIVDYDTAYGYPTRAKYVCVKGAKFVSGSPNIEAKCVMQGYFGYWQYPSDKCEAYCLVELHGFGLNDPPYDRDLFIKINHVQKYKTTSRGFHINSIDNVCQLGQVKKFDTYGDKKADDLMYSHLEQFDSGAIVVGLTADSVSTHLKNGTQLQQLGFSNWALLKSYKASAVFVGNVSNSAAFEHDVQKVYEGPSQLAIALEWKCPVPSIAYSSVNYSDIVPGSIAVHTCHISYHFEIQNYTRSAVCMPSGSWTDVGKCTAIVCPPLPLVKFGTYNSSTCTSGIHTYPHGCNLTCDKGHYRVGDQVNMCLRTAEWSYTNVSSCPIQVCDKLPVIQNGTYDNSDCVTKGGEYKKVCTGSCDIGFYNTNDSVFRCNEHGHWDSTNFTQCQIHHCSALPRTTANVRCPDCEVLPNALNSNFSDPLCDVSGLDYDHNCIATCDIGYNVKGASNLRCNEVGQWSSPNHPYCKLADCNAFPVPGNGSYSPINCQVNGRDYPLSCTLECDFGFRIIGNATQMCQATGLWSDEVNGTFPYCKNAACKPPPEGVNSTLSMPPLPLYFGMYVTHKCIEGYKKTTGDEIRYCMISEEWSGFPLECSLIYCTAPVTPENTIFLNVSQPEYRYQAEIMYTCDVGFELVAGGLTRQCQGDSTFSGSLPVCKKKLCYDLPPVPYSQLLAGSGEYLTDVTYQCITGYEHTGGDLQRHCLLTKKWNGTAPTCQEINCGRAPEVNNTYQNMVSSGYMGQTFYGCDTGYVKINGSDNLTCNSSGEWTGETIQCQEISCGDPPSSSFYSVDVQGTSIYDKHVKHCGDGYEHKSGITTSMCLETGNWEANVPQCKALDCGLPYSFPLATYSQGPTVINSIADYTCVPGTDLQSGVSTSICRENGWSLQDISCIPKQCASQLTVGVVVQYSSGVSHFDVRIVTCADGFTQISGDTASVCMSGSWTGEPHICEVTKCDSPEHYGDSYMTVSGHNINDTVTYQCHENKTLSNGDITRTCSYTGIWNRTASACQDNTCPEITYHPPVYFLTESRSIGSFAYYFCENGFILADNSYTKLECSSDKSWSGVFPTCIAVHCKDSITISHGRINISDTSYNSTATVSCDQGYYLEGGNDVLVCGGNGTWLGDLPHCTATECGMPQVPFHGSMSISGFTTGSTVTYKCDVMYQLSGVHVRTCQPNGSWSHVLPRCHKTSCGKPPIIPFTTWAWDPDLYPSEEQAIYSCMPSYIYDNGSSVKYCLVSGNWSGDDLFCKEITEYYTRSNDAKHKFIFTQLKLVNDPEQTSFTESDYYPGHIGIGSLGIILLVIFLFILLALDISNMRRQFKFLKKNLS